MNEGRLNDDIYNDDDDDDDDNDNNDDCCRDDNDYDSVLLQTALLYQPT